MRFEKKSFFTFSPRLSDFIIIAVFLYWIFFHFMLENFDIWWHLRAGKMILSGFFPKKELFSFTAAGRPWILHEWGSEVIFSLLYSHLGICGLVLARAAILCLTAGVFFTTFMRLSINPILAAILTLIAALAIGAGGINIRPQMFTLFFFTLVLRLYVVSRHSGREKRLFFLLMIFPAWINLHGGFIVGFVLLSLCAFGETIDNLLANKTFFSKNQKKTNKLLIICAGAFFLCLANPNTYRGLLYPLIYRGKAAIPLYSIAEWHPATWVNSKPFFFIVLFLFFFIWISKPKFYFARMVPLLFFMFYTFKFHRIAPFFILCAIMFFARDIESFLHMLFKKFDRHCFSKTKHFWTIISSYISSRSSSLAKIEGKAGLHLFAPVIISAISIILASGQLGSSIPFGAAWNRFPVGNIKVLARYMPGGKIFNQYRWGGILIFTFPEKKVFIDGRMDVYGHKYASEYDTVMNLRAGWKEILKKYGVDHILVERTSIMARFLTAIDPGWKQISTDKLSVLFVKKRLSKMVAPR